MRGPGVIVISMIILLLMANLCHHLFQGRVLLNKRLSQQIARGGKEKRSGYVVTWTIVMLLIAKFCYHLP